MSDREPIFNIPRIVMWLLGAFFTVHVVRLVLPDYQTGWPPEVASFLSRSPWLASLAEQLPDSMWLTRVLAFIPARLGGLAAELPGGQVALFTSFGTHLFVHGDLTHLAVNSAWFLAFASAIARRTSALGFLGFFLLTGAAGALFFTAVNGFEFVMLVGASGAISGLMGAAFRFIFGTDEHGRPHLGESTRSAPLMSLGRTLRDRRVVGAIVGWTVLNVLIALWAVGSLTETAGIAWEAHLGGFAAGLLTYGWFDLPPELRRPPEEEDAAGAA